MTGESGERPRALKHAMGCFPICIGVRKTYPNLKHACLERDGARQRGFHFPGRMIILGMRISHPRRFHEK